MRNCTCPPSSECTPPLTQPCVHQTSDSDAVATGQANSNFNAMASTQQAKPNAKASCVTQVPQAGKPKNASNITKRCSTSVKLPAASCPGVANDDRANGPSPLPTPPNPFTARKART